VHCISFSYSRLYWSFHTLILRRMPAVCTSRNLVIAGAGALRKYSSFDNLLSVAVEACFMQRGIMAIYISWSLQAVLSAFLPGSRGALYWKTATPKFIFRCSILAHDPTIKCVRSRCSGAVHPSPLKSHTEDRPVRSCGSQTSRLI
jgi:hypothetical protein